MNSNFFKYTFIILFIVYIALYLSQVTGYYEFDQYKKTRLTEEKIKAFEQDVKKGNKITIDSYLDKTKKDYNNNISRSGLKLSIILDKIFSTIMNFIVKLFEGLFG
jgi:hypothetical protein